MGYRLAADAVLVTHLAFILWVVLGSLAVLWRPRLALLHLPALAWGVLVEINAWPCPLTPLENHFRLQAGQAGIGASFIEHYLLRLLYPVGLSPAIQWWLGVGLLLFNLPPYAILARRQWRARFKKS